MLVRTEFRSRWGFRIRLVYTSVRMLKGVVGLPLIAIFSRGSAINSDRGVVCKFNRHNHKGTARGHFSTDGKSGWQLPQKLPSTIADVVHYVFWDFFFGSLTEILACTGECIARLRGGDVELRGEWFKRGGSSRGTTVNNRAEPSDAFRANGDRRDRKIAGSDTSAVRRKSHMRKDMCRLAFLWPKVAVRRKSNPSKALTA